MTDSTVKIAGAPISWGICEVPSWGYQLSPGRVLTEMQQVGLAATEFGPGRLPARRPGGHRVPGLRSPHRAVGGFTPVVLHEADHDPSGFSVIPWRFDEQHRARCGRGAA